MNSISKNALITGASSGLGLALTRHALRETTWHLILPVRNAQRAHDLRAALGDAALGRISTPIMDLASLTSVRACSQSLKQPLDVVMLNAGVQSAEQLIFTEDAMEQTFAVNHLAHHILLRTLEPQLALTASIGWVSSGTHHNELAKGFGYNGAQYLVPEVLAKGQFASPPRQASRDAYSTSKGLNIVSARHWARLSEQQHQQWRTFSFDPGLMPGTGLAREGSAATKLAWKYVLPLVGKLMKGTSTPEQSSAMLARLLSGQHGAQNGDYIEFTGDVLQPHLPSNELEYAKTLFEFGDRFVC